MTFDDTTSGNSTASRDIAFHLHPYTNPSMLRKTGPHIIERGEGVFVHDDNGQKFYEGMSGLWAGAGAGCGLGLGGQTQL